MAVGDWSTDPNLNGTPPGIVASEGMSPGSINNTMRQMMADLRAWYDTVLAAITASTNYIAANVLYENTVVYNPPILASGQAAAVQTLTVTGAALGMEAHGAFSEDLQGIWINAWVSAADTVKFQFVNLAMQDAAIDLANGTVTIRVRG